MAVSVVTGGILTAGGGTQTFNVGTLSLTGGVNYVVVFITQNGSVDAGRSVTINGSAASELLTPPSSGGGYTGMTAYGLANPTAGTVSVDIGSTDDCAITVIPLAGVDTDTPFGTWVAPGNSYTSTAATGTITGVDSSGLFLGLLGSLGTDASSYGGATQVSNYSPNANIRGGVYTKAGAASGSFSITMAAEWHCSIMGVYVNAGGASAVAPIVMKWRM